MTQQLYDDTATGDRPALTITEEGFQRAVDALEEGGPLVDVFLASGLELPLPIFMKYRERLSLKLTDARYQCVQIADGYVHLPLTAPLPWESEDEAFRQRRGLMDAVNGLIASPSQILPFTATPKSSSDRLKSFLKRIWPTRIVRKSDGHSDPSPQVSASEIGIPALKWHMFCGSNDPKGRLL